MKLKVAGAVLLSAVLVLMSGCKKNEDTPESSVPPATISSTTLPDTSEPVSKVNAAVVSGVADGLNVRSEASTESSILGKVENGDKLRLLQNDKDGDFYQVAYLGTTGYVYAQYVKIEEIDVTQLSDESTVPLATKAPQGGNIDNSQSESQGSQSAQNPEPAPTEVPTPTPDIVTKHDGEV